MCLKCKCMRACFSILFTLFSIVGFSQNIGGFSDYQDHFYVFDDGKTRQLEFQPVLNFEVGDKCLGYTSNGGTFKIYCNHIQYEIGALLKSYKVTDNLVSYQVGSQLYVFEDGNKKLLSRLVGNYFSGDSLVAFIDNEKHYFLVYYKGEILPLEDGILFENISSFKVGENVLCYIDAYQNFKVFYQGETYELVNSPRIKSKVGRNIVAYIDADKDALEVFYKGDNFELESFRPKSYQVGYEKVAYVTNTGDFKLFDDGETYTISTYPPDSYELKDNMLVYQQQNQLFAFYNGEQFVIENYIPSSYKLNDYSIAYLDQNGYLKLFHKGEILNLTYDKINDFDVYRNVVIYNEGMNTTKIYYNGKTYTP